MLEHQISSQASKVSDGRVGHFAPMIQHLLAIAIVGVKLGHGGQLCHGLGDGNSATKAERLISHIKKLSDTANINEVVGLLRFIDAWKGSKT